MFPSSKGPDQLTKESGGGVSKIPVELVEAGIHPAARKTRNEFIVDNTFRDKVPKDLERRPGFNTSGKPVKVQVNSHKILSYPTKPVSQYDVVIGNGAEKRGLIKSVWESPNLQKAVGPAFIFDGNKIGWTYGKIPDEIRLMIDLDKERGVVPRDDRPVNQHRVLIKKTSAINLDAIRAYLSEDKPYGPQVQEAITFLDHLLRETPSKVHIAQKRSFFGRDTQGDKCMIGGGVEAMKGVYQSIRMAQGGRLVVNVDVSNSTFWGTSCIAQLAFQITGASNYYMMEKMVKSVEARPGGPFRESIYMAALRKLNNNDISIRFRNASDAILNKTFRIERVDQDTARTHRFNLTNKQTGLEEKNVSVEEYFKRRYNVHLEWPELPLIEVTRKKKRIMYPMEVCFMNKGQKYPYKLDEQQTANMIKFAVSRPAERKKAIQRGLDMLDWKKDPFLSNYGLKIEPTMLTTEARVLDPPLVQYRDEQMARPGYSGRWDLRGKKFLHENPAKLLSWGVILLGKRTPPMEAVKLFIKTFVTVYRGHGGVVENDQPLILVGGTDSAQAVFNLFAAVGNKHKMRPQLLMIVLDGKNPEQYARVKKSADCRFGVVSQCIQSAHLMKNQQQYHSNVCMKINAKLGGTTCRVALPKGKTGQFAVPTMIIGADVTHPAPGSASGCSYGAITVSMDKICARYAAAVESNGERVEILTAKSIEDMLRPLVQHWCEEVSGGRVPTHVYYFRDGVSEGQYGSVLRDEIGELKKVFASFGQHDPLFTVVVAEKRHHTRFFPTPGPGADRNGNSVPGTLVEKDVTHPFLFDFYLCSHSAIQGTARPTHYHILLNECKIEPEIFQKMIYDHSYQYMRSTTPVSIFPAIYYAHLASHRARSHIDKSYDTLQREKELAKVGLVISEQRETETKPLIPMANQTGIRYGMWYI